jgi:hypothetical protein
MSLLDRTNSGARASRAETPRARERRSKDRKRQRLVDGFISSGRMPPQPCTVCDISAGGSKVELWNDLSKLLQPGDRITLYIPVDRQEVNAEVRWRKENTAGLKFTSTFRAPTRPYD